MIAVGHQPESIPPKVKIMCCVCQLELQFQNSSLSNKREDGSSDKGAFSTRNIAACTNDSCRQHFHCIRVQSTNYMFELPQFEGMAYFEIAHHKSTVVLWSSNPNFKYKEHGAQDVRKKNKKHAYL